MLRRSSLIVFIVLLVACAGARAPTLEPTGLSDLEILPPPPDPPLPLGSKPRPRLPQSAPEVQQRILPGYPDVALQDEVTCAARLLYHILKDGTVTLVRLEWDEPPPAQYRSSFEDSIQQAMAGWRYTPGKKWVPRKNEDGSTSTVPQVIPKAERAILRFRVEEGQGVVE